MTRRVEAKKTPDLESFDGARLRVALCQVETREWDMAGNIARTLDALDQAAALGAQLAVTPECVLDGYAQGHDLPARLAAVAEPLDGPAVGAVRARARDLGLALALGFAETGADGALHNSLLLADSAGTILQHYRKVHLRDFESVAHGGPFTPGDRFEVSTLRAGGSDHRVGAMICFDRELPESLRCLRALGAELVVCPLACDTNDARAPRDFVDNEVTTRVRATENELFIAIVNHAGRFNGGSWVAGPGGEVVVQMDERPGVAVADLPVGITRRGFHDRPLGWMGWGYRRPEIYDRYLTAPPDLVTTAVRP